MNSATNPSRKPHSPLLHPNFILLMAGEAISLFGNTMLRFAMSMWVLDQTGSATTFSTLLALSMVPTIVLSPFGGVVADRVNRKKMMVMLDAISGCVVLIATLGFNVMQAHTIASIAVLLVVLSMLDALESPTTSAAIPQMLGRSNPVLLRQAQAVSNQLSAIMQIIPTFTGGTLYAILGIQRMLEITTICFFATAALECFIRLSDTRTKGNTTIGSPLDDIVQTSDFMRRTSNLLALMLVIAALNFFLSGVSSVGLPYIIRTALGFGADVYGYSDSIMSVVSLLGSVAVMALASKLAMHHMPMTIYASALCFLPIATVFLVHSSNWAKLITLVVCFCLITLAIDFCNVIIEPSIMEITPDAMMAKIVALSTTISLCVSPLGQMAYGLLFDHMPVWAIMCGTGICLAVLGVTVTPLARKVGAQLAAQQSNNNQ